MTADPASSDDVILIEPPPRTVRGILQRLGPGLIIAGSIVGSGELIATTKTGAEAGFLLLWLILIGCVIKVFVQVEMGRYTIVSGKTALGALSEVPGPRLAGGNWLLWWWLLMFLASIGQLGGIVGGVGQALQISVPLTEQGRHFNEQVDAETLYRVARAELQLARRRADRGDQLALSQLGEIQTRIDGYGPWIVQDRLLVARQQAQQLGTPQIQAALRTAEARAARWPKEPDRVFSAEISPASGLDPAVAKALPSLGRRSSPDDKIWAIIVGLVTSVVLLWGRYSFIQSFSAVMVASFTLITIVNVVMLQSNPYWAVTGDEVLRGLSFQLPTSSVLGATPIATALATFGIIGVGANELISYPYWCLEKGYARFTGPHDKTPEWAERARGWLRVMRWDAWCSMAVYTFATLAFYLLGAAVLGRTGLNPSGSEMIRTLGVMYEPVFGFVARWVFLFGAFAVLYSTLFVASASHARVFPDGLRAFRLGPKTEQGYRRSIRLFSGIFPLLCVVVYTVLPSPAMLVLFGGAMQGIMLPMLAAAALFFRYRRTDRRIAPGRLWDFFLWLSSAGMLITGVWTFWNLALQITGR